MAKKVLVTLNFNPSILAGFDESVKALEAKGYEVVVDPRYKKLTKEELIEALKGVYAHVASAEKYTEDVFAEVDSLKVISRMGIGYEMIDVDAATKHGVALTITPGANAEPVAEFTMALMMALTRRVKEIDAETRKGTWKGFFGTSLYGKTLGIIGMGNIGKVLNRIVSGFGMKVIAYDPFQNPEYAAKNNFTYVTLDELYAQSDFISFHIPLTEENKNLITAKEFAKMKTGVQIINCARGKIINEKDLYDALVSKKVAGVGLDVFDNEPLNMDSPLLTLDNVIVSCHTAGMTYEGRQKVVDFAFQNVVDIAEGKQPNGLINPLVFKK